MYIYICICVYIYIYTYIIFMYNYTVIPYIILGGEGHLLNAFAEPFAKPYVGDPQQLRGRLEDWTT